MEKPTKGSAAPSTKAIPRSQWPQLVLTASADPEEEHEIQEVEQQGRPSRRMTLLERGAIQLESYLNSLDGAGSQSTAPVTCA